MKLHAAPGTISSAIAIVLFELGVKFETIWVDFKTGEQTGDAYASINPKKRVPALVLDDGTVLSETGAILEYLAASHPAGLTLMSADPLLAARVRMVMYYLASTMHVNHAHKMRGARWARLEASFEDMRSMVARTMAQSAQYLEDEIFSKAPAPGPYVLGDKVSIADAYAYAVCCWLEPDGVDLAPYPALRDFIEAMEGRISVQAARDAGFAA